MQQNYKIVRINTIYNFLIACIQRDSNPRQLRIRPERTALDHSAMNACMLANCSNYIHCLNIRKTTTYHKHNLHLYLYQSVCMTYSTIPPSQNNKQRILPRISIDKHFHTRTHEITSRPGTNILGVHSLAGAGKAS